MSNVITDAKWEGAITMFLLILVIASIVFHVVERNCQVKHDVADCEIKVKFIPVTKKDK